MKLKTLKIYQNIAGILMLFFFGSHLYLQFIMQYEGAFYYLTKSIFEWMLTLTFHFSLIQTKLTKPHNYKESLHKMVVILWSFLGSIHLIAFLNKLL
ncbi:hypothetical protein [Emticicia oligotrophica]|uniref:hypothetical protein n=1 Tax=Emticicia oligotrophica TaxID=312279 RepID=UPI0003061E10|nr:hypothetical protein [Emticicia oligotrophica]